MKITGRARFKKAWQEVTEGEKELGRKALRNLATDLGYPAPRVTKIQGTGHTPSDPKRESDKESRFFIPLRSIQE